MNSRGLGFEEGRAIFFLQFGARLFWTNQHRTPATFWYRLLVLSEMFCGSIAHSEERREVYYEQEMVTHSSVSDGSFRRADGFEAGLRCRSSSSS
jgi:hypothetical protein